MREQAEAASLWRRLGRIGPRAWLQSLEKRPESAGSDSNETVKMGIAAKL
jgi:hypothetical protein